MVWGCLRKISCAEAPPEDRKPRLSWDDVARRNLGNQERRRLTWPDSRCTPYGEGVSQVSAEAASVNQEAPPSMSTHLDNTGVV